MTLDACAALVERGDPDRWLSLMSVPVAARAKLLPLYAFNLEVARAPWVSDEPMIGQMRLQWWRDVLAEVADGGAVRHHEVATPLAEVLPQQTARDLDGLILMRHRDLDATPFSDTAALVHYLEETGGRLLIAGAEILGAKTRGLADAGYAGALSSYLMAAGALRARGHQALPDDTPEAIVALARDGMARWTLSRRVGCDPDATPALRALWRSPAILSLAARAPARVLTGGLDTSPARRHLSLITRQMINSW